MPRPSHQPVVDALLARHGRSYCEELGIAVARNTPAPLFQLLCLSLLLSARIRSEQAVKAMQAVLAAGWTTPGKLAATDWEQRVALLNRNGYARYDESTARRLGETVALLESRYRGDLRRLREAASRKPARERELLAEFKGIGETGVDIFFREVQCAWDELYPFADRRSLDAAGRLGLPEDARALSRLVDRATYPRLVAALVRSSLARDAARILGEAK